MPCWGRSLVVDGHPVTHDQLCADLNLVALRLAAWNDPADANGNVEENAETPAQQSFTLAYLWGTNRILEEIWPWM